MNWQSLLSVIELAGNVATELIPGGAGFAPLEAALEAAVNPFLMSIGQKQTASSEIMNVYATIIGILTTLKNVPGTPAATLTKIDGYLTAAQNGTASYLQAAGGFDPTLFTPVTPIA